MDRWVRFPRISANSGSLVRLMKKLLFLALIIATMGCGKKGAPRPIEKQETPKQSTLNIPTVPARILA